MKRSQNRSRILSQKEQKQLTLAPGTEGSFYELGTWRLNIISINGSKAIGNIPRRWKMAGVERTIRKKSRTGKI